MEMQEFINNFCNELDDTNPELITLSTVFKELKEWDSLVALTIIAMVDEEYEVRVTGSDLLESKTIEDLFNLIKSKA